MYILQSHLKRAFPEIMTFTFAEHWAETFVPQLYARFNHDLYFYRFTDIAFSASNISCIKDVTSSLKLF